MLPLAMMIFKEQLSNQAVIVAVLGFIGVLVVIRPTYID
jgi:drug/metabolite transporter (DMT)-like permease